MNDHEPDHDHDHEDEDGHGHEDGHEDGAEGGVPQWTSRTSSPLGPTGRGGSGG
jgi:hypothetical protein